MSWTLPPSGEAEPPDIPGMACDVSSHSASTPSGKAEPPDIPGMAYGVSSRSASSSSGEAAPPDAPDSVGGTTDAVGVTSCVLSCSSSGPGLYIEEETCYQHQSL